MVRLLIIILMLMVNASAHSYKLDRYMARTSHVKVDIKEAYELKKAFSKLNRKQWRLLRKAYRQCETHGFGNTCMAIAYQESRIGRYMVIESTGDYGLLGINLKTYLADNNIKAGYYTKLHIITRLVRDDDFNIRVAIANLTQWSRVYKNKKNKWRLIWGSYNGGTFPNYIYAQHILNILSGFRLYFRTHPKMKLYVKGE